MSEKSLAVIFASIGAVLVACAVVILFVIQPPAIGWLGFAIVSIVLLAMGGFAPFAFERTRVSAQRAAVRKDHDLRLLVIADPHCDENVLCEEIAARVHGEVAVHVVVPVRVSHLHFLTDDESEERQEAVESMSFSVRQLERHGISTTGSVGSDKPLESMTDALGTFPATHVLLATPPESDSYWLEHDLLAKARVLTSIPVTQIVIPTKSEDRADRTVVTSTAGRR